MHNNRPVGQHSVEGFPPRLRLPSERRAVAQSGWRQPNGKARKSSMRLGEAYSQGKFGLSFEVFPPKSAESEADLFRHLEELLRFQPAYVTCTYGAGGSTRAKTLQIVGRIRKEFGCTVASHLTCVGSSVDELREYLRQAAEQGVENVVALRGDPPQGSGQFQVAPGGLRYANELVELIRREFPALGVAVGGYPETHQEAPSPQADLENLRRKVDAGADVVITQLFYDNADFWRFRERYEALPIPVPLVPGILPITNFAQVRRITALCGAKLPAVLAQALERNSTDAAAQFEVGVDHATQQVRELLQGGVPGLHFYVLNKSPATAQVLRAVGRVPANC